MARPAPPSTPLAPMVSAIYYSRSSLAVAGRSDRRRTDEDRAFFEAQALVLQPVIEELEPIEDAIRRFERGPHSEAQAGVVLGDIVLDATVRDGCRQTKAALTSPTGLGAQHAFGERVDDLVGIALRLEPEAVQRAADRLAQVPDFASKASIQAELRFAATRQEEALDVRDAAARAENELESRAASAVVRASEALSRLEARLLDRFPRQYAYVGGFFMDLSKKRRPRPTKSE